MMYLICFELNVLEAPKMFIAEEHNTCVHVMKLSMKQTEVMLSVEVTVNEHQRAALLTLKSFKIKHNKQ